MNGLNGASIFLVAANSQDQTVGPTHSENAALFWNETQSWGTLYVTPFQSSVAVRFGTTQVGNRMFYSRPASVGSGFTLTSAFKNGSTDSIYVNGELVLSQGGKLSMITGCRDTASVGRGFNDDTYYAGEIAEILVYVRALTASEQATVETYLKDKYALSSPNGAPPQITAQPADATVAEANPASFTVQASGAAPLAYQWRRDGVTIAGATSASYTLSNTSQSADDGARFDVVAGPWRRPVALPP